MAELTIKISEMNGINEKIDLNPLFEAETITGNRSVSVDKLRILLALNSKEVGKMYFRPYNKITSLELPCDGQELNKADYPYLYEEIEGLYGETETTFKLPDLRDYPFPAHRKIDGEIGTSRTDTMRKILGFGGENYIKNDVPSTGVFTASNSITQNTRLNPISATGFTVQGLGFDSSKGIEGQEGSTSPNVGQKTAPAHLLGVWVIRVKP